MPTTAYQHSLASAGFMPDMAYSELPPTAWPDGQNMRFVRGAARTVEGMEAAHTVTTSLIFATNVYNATSNFWVLASPAAMYATDGSTVTNITRVSATTTVIAYTATNDKGWTSASFGNFLVLNNGMDVPQSWNLDPAAEAANLSNWPATWIAQSVRTYRNYLVALDITIGSDRYPSLVAWSDAASYDALPSTWVPATTNDAGDNNLNDTPGWIIDGLTLGGSFIIYKEDSIWAMTYVGGSTVMGFRKLFDGVGLFTRRCVAEVDGRHFFLGRGDVYMHDGVSLQSVATQRVREYLFDRIDPTTYSRAFVTVDRDRREVWACYPTSGGFPDEALVYNYETNVWYPPRSIPATAFIATGIINSSGSGTSFDSDPGTFDGGDAGPFDARGYNPSTVSLLAVVPGLAKLYKMNTGTQQPASEAVRTNLLTYSGQFDNAAWIKTRGTISVSVASSPVGTADRFTVDTTAASTHLFYRAYTFTSSLIYVLSIYAKAEALYGLRLQVGAAVWSDATAKAVSFDLVNGTRRGAESPYLFDTISLEGDGWVRCNIAFTPEVAAISNLNFSGLDSSYATTFDGNGTDSFLIDGVQLEIISSGTSPTEYIVSGATPGTSIDTDYESIPSYLSRPLLPFDGADNAQGPIVWTPQMKLIRRVWVDATGTGTIQVYIGTQDTESAATTWHGPFAINLADRQFVWTFVRGRFISIKFASDSIDTTYTLTGYKLDWEPVGAR